jgi:hypothetical protein
MHAMLTQAIERYDGQLAYAVLPFPLNRRCNAWLPEGYQPDRYDRSCEIARLALAVHRSDPQAFALWDHWMISYNGTAPLAGAVDKAVELVGREALDSTLSEPWIDQQLRRNVELFIQLPHDVRDTVPVLIMDGHYVKGAPAEVRQLHELLEEKLGQRPPAQ